MECPQRKKDYLSYDRAMAACKAMRLKNREHGDKERPAPYKCRHCGSWHIGSIYVPKFHPHRRKDDDQTA